MTANDTQAITLANQQFAMALYQEVAARENGNFVISPILFSIGLALLLNGADEKTRQQIFAATGLGGIPVDTLNREFAELFRRLEELNAGDKQMFALATSVWASKPLEFTPSFLDAAQRYYSAEVRSVARQELPHRVSE